MATRDCEQFIFEHYAWSGPSIDQLFADAAAINGRDREVALDGYFNRSDVATAMEQARVSPTTRRVAKQFRYEDRPRLFLELGNARLTPAGILDFIGQNGLLSGGKSDSAIEFVREARSMQRALDYAFLWNSAEAPRPFGRASFSPTNELLDEGQERIRSGLRSGLQKCINARLLGALPTLDENLRLASGSRRLDDAIWFQFAKAIDAGRLIGRCRQCGKFFEVASGAGRTDKAYCSNACTVAAYRSRKRVAAKLRTEGATLREISKQLGSDVSTVKGWLQKGEK